MSTRHRTMAADYGRRDRIAAALCNWIMRRVASERYRKMIGGSVSYGMASALRDDLEGREAPAPLWDEAAKAYAEGRLKPLPRKPQVRPESDFEMNPARGMLRAERHPGDPDKGADEE